ncbi:MAG: GrpB family protein [Pseudonocardiaceae bacterium]
MSVERVGSRVIRVVPYDPQWPARFAELGRGLRDALGEVALRIDHIGSTAVVGLAAKPVIDIQISVAALEPVDPFREPLARRGFVYRANNTERTKRYFREPPGEPRTHIHVRRAGSFSEQFPLLFRDYLRAHPDESAAYERLKRRLATEFHHDGAAYANAKVPLFWEVIRHADDWAQRIGWEPGPSDA